MIRWLRRGALSAFMMSVLPGSVAQINPPVPLRVITSAVPHAEILRFTQKLAPDLPLKIIIIDATLRPNELLATGEADANFFQHVPYLRQQEHDLGTKFVVVAAVHIEPLGIYSRKIHALAERPKNSTASIPNNVVNLSRALFLLQDQGLIRLRPDFTERDRQMASQHDIVANPKQLKLLTSPAVAVFIRERYRGSVIPLGSLMPAVNAGGARPA